MRIREYTPADFEALRRLHAAQGFGYPLPDLANPLFITKLVLETEQEEDEDAIGKQPRSNQSREEVSRDSLSLNAHCEATIDATCAQPRKAGGTVGGLRQDSLAHSKSSRIVMAVLLRLTAETYLLHDPTAGTPRQRWQHLLALHEATRQAAAERGLDDVQAFLPPRIARSFGRRLTRLGWARDPWPCFSRRVP